MSDPVFTGTDLQAALASAALALGREVGNLRYVVLDGGSPGGRGLSPTPARVAVILEKQRVGGDAQKERLAARDTKSQVREVLDQVIRTAQLSVHADVEVGDEALVVSLTGDDRGFFIGAEGEGDVLRSLEHLLLGMFGRSIPGGRIVVNCEGFRERREEALRQRALDLAEAVRGDGVARETVPLNSYERRLIHMAVSAVPGVVTYSVGEGPDRRVTISMSGQSSAEDVRREPIN